MPFKEYVGKVLDDFRERSREEVYGNRVLAAIWVPRSLFKPPRPYQHSYDHDEGTDETIRRFNEILPLSEDDINEINSYVEGKESKITHDRAETITEGRENYVSGIDIAMRDVENATGHSKWGFIISRVVPKYKYDLGKLISKYKNSAEKDIDKISRYIFNLIDRKQRIANGTAARYVTRHKPGYKSVLSNIEKTSDRLKNKHQGERISHAKDLADIPGVEEELMALDLEKYLKGHQVKFELGTKYFNNEMSEILEDMQREKDSKTGSQKAEVTA